MSEDKEIMGYDERGNLIHYKCSNDFEWWRKYDENNNRIYFKGYLGSDYYEEWDKYDKNRNIIYCKSNIGSKKYEAWFRYDKNNKRIDITKEKIEEKEYLSRTKCSRFKIMDI